MSNSEKGCDFIESFVFCFRNFFVGEDPEEGQEDAEREEGVVLEGGLHRREPDPDKEVGTPEKKYFLEQRGLNSRLNQYKV